MIIRSKKIHLYSAFEEEKRLQKKRRRKVLLFCEPILFYIVVALLMYESAWVLLPEKLRFFGYIFALSIVLFMPAIYIVSSYFVVKRMGEQVYLEHISYLYCKHLDFKKALMEIRDLFPRKEEVRVINLALYSFSQSGNPVGAMKHIESYFSGRRVKLLHRYILEAIRNKNYVPPAEIITCLTESSEWKKRSHSKKRVDRFTILLCGIVSIGICIFIEAIAKKEGLISMEYDSSYVRIFSMAIVLVSFVLYEIFECKSIFSSGQNRGITNTVSYLRDLSFFLLIMPVRKAITKSVGYADWRIRNRASKLAAKVDTVNSVDEYLCFAERFHDEKLTRVMELLYAKSEEAYLSPVELTPMLRMLDEIDAREKQKVKLEEKRQRMNLLLAPQVAAFAMLFGNIINLIGTIEGKI